MAKRGEGHGGKRDGSGRPKGSRMRRSEALAEELIKTGKCPVQALVRLAEQCEAQGEIKEAIGAWKGVLPYVYPKPKAVESEPERAIELARELFAMRAEATKKDVDLDHVAMVEQALAKMEGRQAD